MFYFRGFYNKFIKGDIKNKIIIYAITLLLSILLVIGVIAYYISSSTIMDRNAATNVEIVNQSMGGIDFVLKSIENSAMQTFDEINLAELLDKAKKGTNADQVEVDNAINNSIKKLMYLRNEVDNIYIIGENYTQGEQKGIYSNELYARLQVINENQFKSLLKNQEDKFVWTYVVKEGTEVVPVKKLGLCRAIIGNDNSYKGFILIMVREGIFEDIYSNLFQNKRQVYLVDDDGLIVSSPDRASIGQIFLNTFSLNDTQPAGIKEINNKKHVISSALSQYTGWKLYTIDPLEIVISSVSTIKWWITIAILTCVIVFIFLSVFLSNILTNPIKKLTIRASSIKNYEDTVEKVNSLLVNNTMEKKAKVRSLNFRTKLFIMLFTIIIVPVMLLMTVTYYVSFEIVKTKSEELNILNARQVRIKLEYYLSSFEKSIYDLYSETELNNILRQIALGNNAARVDEKNKKVLSEALLNMTEKNRDILYTQLFDVDKNLLSNFGSSKQDIPGHIFESIDSYIETKNIWYGPYQNYYKQNVITLGKRIKDMNDFITTGYMFVSTKEIDLEGIYSNFNQTHNLLFIIDENGNIISHPNKNLLNTKINLSLGTLSDENVDNAYIKDNDGKSKMVSFDTIRNTGWKVVLISSMDTVTQNMNQMLIYYFIAILILTCISIAIITFKVSKRIGKPLNELSKKVRTFANGDTAANNVEFSTGDEIEQLNDSFNNMMQRISNLIVEVYETRIRKNEAELNSKEAELTLLQAQINPHFLYNTLEIIRWKAMFLTNGENEVTEIVTTLSDFFRLSLSKGEKIISLKDEIDHAKNYITIMNYRYTNKIAVEWHIEECLLDRKVPKIILQPVIENAIYHGIKPKSGQGVIDVYVMRKDNNIELEVKDNGVGMNSQAIERLNSLLSGVKTFETGGYGLRNVNQRIKLIFGDDYGIRINSVLNTGTSVYIHLPEKIN